MVYQRTRNSRYSSYARNCRQLGRTVSFNIPSRQSANFVMSYADAATQYGLGDLYQTGVDTLNDGQLGARIGQAVRHPIEYLRNGFDGASLGQMLRHPGSFPGDGIDKPAVLGSILRNPLEALQDASKGTAITGLRHPQETLNDSLNGISIGKEVREIGRMLGKGITDKSHQLQSYMGNLNSKLGDSMVNHPREWESGTRLGVAGAGITALGAQIARDARRIKGSAQQDLIA